MGQDGWLWVVRSCGGKKQWVGFFFCERERERQREREKSAACIEEVCLSVCLSVFVLI